MDAGDRGPGGVVVRRLRLAGAADRGIEREAAIGIFGQPIDLAMPVRRHGEMREGEKLGAPAERDQFGFDRGEGHRREERA